MINRMNPPVTARSKAGSAKPPAIQSVRNSQVATRQRTVAPRTISRELAPEQRQQLIAQAAYFIAERRGFVPGNELDDWLQAEAEIDACIRAALQ